MSFEMILGVVTGLVWGVSLLGAYTFGARRRK